MSEDHAQPRGVRGRSAPGPMGELVVVCECGFEARGEEDDVVEQTQEHGRDVHNMEVTREQVLAMAKPA